jgi:Protein of unknown function (DUF3237)
VRAVTALLVCLGLTLCGLFTLAQTSARAPAMAASSAHPANEPPHAGHAACRNRYPHRCRKRPAGTRTIVQLVGGRFEGPRVKASVQTPAGDWITNRADGSYGLTFA